MHRLTMCWRLGLAVMSLAATGAAVIAVVALAPGLRADEDELALARRIDRLVAQLGAEAFKDREAASRELTELGAKAKPALLRAQETSKDQEVKQRVERLLADLGGEKDAEGKGSGSVEPPRVIEPEELSPERVLELLREGMRRLPGTRFDLRELDGQQRVVVIDDGVRYEFARDKAGAFEIVVTKEGEAPTRHAFKDEAEFKAAQPALHERWVRMKIDLSGPAGGPGAEGMLRMLEEQRRLMEKLLGGEGLDQSIQKMIEAQRRRMEERMRGLDLEEVRRRLREELGGAAPDREAFDRALRAFEGAKTVDELRRAFEQALGELRRARGEERPADPVPVPVPAPAPAPWRMGLRLAPPSEVLREQLGLEGGAVVQELDPAGPFATSGLAPHDIAVEAGGAKLAGPDALIAALEALGPGQAVAVVVVRRGQRVSLELKRR